MRRLLAVILFCAGIFCVAQGNAQFNGCQAGFCNGSPSSSGGPGFSSPRTSGATYTAQGVHFNGSTDMQTSVAFTGAPSSSAVGTLSFWYQSTGGNGTTRGILNANAVTGNCTVQLVQLSSNVLRFALGNVSSILVSFSFGSTAFMSGDAWRWVGLSWNLATPTFQMYVNGVSDSPSGTPSSGNMNYTSTCFNGWAFASI